MITIVVVNNGLVHNPKKQLVVFDMEEGEKNNVLWMDLIREHNDEKDKTLIYLTLEQLSNHFAYWQDKLKTKFPLYKWVWNEFTGADQSYNPPSHQEED